MDSVWNILDILSNQYHTSTLINAITKINIQGAIANRTYFIKVIFVKYISNTFTPTELIDNIMLCHVWYL